MKQHSGALRPRGFSLVEVMVSLIVISVGLLGVAKMQAVSLASTNSARIRSLAAIEAASLASAMHANRGYWAFNAPIVNVAGMAITSTDGGLTTGGNCTVGGGSAPCTTTRLAAADLQEWATEMNGMLPLSTATITCSNLTIPLSCTIQINWKENAVAMTQQATAANFQTQSYLLYVEP